MAAPAGFAMQRAESYRQAVHPGVGVAPQPPSTAATPPPIVPAMPSDKQHAVMEEAMKKIRGVVDLVAFTSFVRAQVLAEAATKGQAGEVGALGHAEEGESGDGGKDAAAAAATGEDIGLQRQDKHLATGWGTSRSLINAAVSGGVLVLAFEIPKAGSGLLILLLILMAMLAAETLLMLYKASLHFDTSSYTGLARKALGKRWARLVALSLVLGQFGLIVGYANIMRDTIPWVIQYNAVGCVEVPGGPSCDFPWYLTSAFIISMLMVFLILPISLRGDPDVFATISFTTFLHFTLFLCLVIWGAVTYWPSNNMEEVLTRSQLEQLNSTGNITASTSLFPRETSAFIFNTDTVLAIAILAFSMSAHTTGMPILHGMRMVAGCGKEVKMRLITKVVYGSYIAVFVYYVVIMLSCYMAFGPSVSDNCLNSFPSSAPFAMVVRCTFFFELGTSVPLYLYSMRRDMTATALDIDGDQAEMDKIEQDNWWRTALITLLILASSTAIGLVGSLAVILGFTGSIVTSFNLFIFPGIMYWTTGLVGGRRIVALPIAVFGVFILVVALYGQISDLL